jgi:hypothetical protein
VPASVADPIGNPCDEGGDWRRAPLLQDLASLVLAGVDRGHQVKGSLISIHYFVDTMIRKNGFRSTCVNLSSPGDFDESILRLDSAVFPHSDSRALRITL